VTRNGVADTLGEIDGDVRDEIVNNKTILLSSNGIAGEIIMVWLSTINYNPPVTTVNISVLATPITEYITLPDPVVNISKFTVDDTDMTWDFDEFDSAFTIPATFTLVPSGTNHGYYINKPNWIALIDSTTGDQIVTIIDGLVAYIYPYTQNNYSVREGMISFVDDYGNPVTITVHQLGEAVAPDIEVNPLINPMYPYGKDNTPLFMDVSCSSGSASDGSPNISITFVIVDIALGEYGVELFLNYIIWIDRGGNQLYAGDGQINGTGCYNGISKTATMTMNQNAATYDIINVYISEV
jgi:hypothetical protein